MSEKRIFEVGYIEYPETSLIYRSIKIDVSNYPELEGKTDDEVIKYIGENAWKMKSADEDYNSLAEELSEQDIIREKIPHVGSEIWAEVSNEDDDSDDEEDDYDEEDD